MSAVITLTQREDSICKARIPPQLVVKNMVDAGADALRSWVNEEDFSTVFDGYIIRDILWAFLEHTPEDLAQIREVLRQERESSPIFQE